MAEPGPPPAPCKTCLGSGRVAPSAFADDVEPWPKYLARAAALLASAPGSASAAADGRVRPLDCPDCGPRGVADGPP